MLEDGACLGVVVAWPSLAPTHDAGLWEHRRVPGAKSSVMKLIEYSMSSNVFVWSVSQDLCVRWDTHAFVPFI